MDFTTGTNPVSVAIGDVDGDGRPDVVTANYGSSTASVLWNNPLRAITGTFTVCGGAATALSDATTGGTWSSRNAAIATVSTAGTVTGIAIGAAVITYAGTAGISFTGNYVTATVTVNAAPAVTVTPTSPAICIGSSATITATGASTYSWSPVTGLSASTGATVSCTASVTTTYTISGTNASGCTGQTTVIVTPASQQWKGAASTAWSNTANWTCGAVPVATENVVIPGPSSYTFAPTLDVSAGYVNNLAINASAALTLGAGNQLYVAGNLSNSGSIAGAGVVNLNGSSAQVISGNGTLNNMALGNTLGATVSATTGDSLHVKGTLSLNSGTLATNNKLILVSDALGTGNIGAITGGAISGNVTVQQYFPGGRRAFRFIAHPFTSSLPLSQYQQYVDVTGIGGAANGFTPTVSNAPSAYWYNPLYGNSASGSDPGWRAFTNTNNVADSNQLHQYEGMRLFIRGSKGEGLTGATYTADSVTIITWGTVNTGAVSMSLIKGTGANEDYNLIGNPYPSPADIGAVISNASSAGQLTGAAFYVWNPYLGTSGQFVALPIGPSYYLGANEAFEVRTAANGNQLSFTESNKAAAESAILLKTATGKDLALTVYDTAYHPWDMLHIMFNGQATTNEDAHYDGMKPPSPASLNFYSLSADNKKLSIDARPDGADSSIPLGIVSAYAQGFIIKVDDMPAATDQAVYLHDKYIGQYILLQQGTEYKFAITKDAASQGESRFELSMKVPGIGVGKNGNGLDVHMLPNPAADNVSITYAAATSGPTAVRITDVSGAIVVSKDMGSQQSGTVVIPVGSLAAGLYMVELTCGKEKVVQKLIKE